MSKGRTVRKKPHVPKPLGTYRGRPGERTLEQRREDVERVAELFLRGHTCAQITEKINAGRERKITLATVLEDLKRVHTIWAQQIGDSLAASRNRVLAELQAVRRAAWEAFELSKKSVETKQKLKNEGAGPVSEGTLKVIGAERVTKDNSPAVEFLEVILDVNKRECEIMGLTSEVNLHWHPTEKPAEEKPATVTEARVHDYFLKKRTYTAKVVDVESVSDDRPAITPPAVTS